MNQADDRQPERLRFGGTGRGRSLEGREMLRMYRLKVWTGFVGVGLAIGCGTQGMCSVGCIANQLFRWSMHVL